jgi:hypothetical protein
MAAILGLVGFRVTTIRDSESGYRIATY